MALADAQLQTDIRNILTNCKDGMTPTAFADALATAIQNYVKTGSVSGDALATGAVAGGQGVPVPILNLPIT